MISYRAFTSKNLFTPVLYFGLTACLVACGAADAELEEQNDEIFGGREATVQQLTYQARIEVSGQFRCGGVLIHPDWVLAAAHCIASSSNAGAYTVILGDVDRRNNEPATEQRITARQLHIHPDWTSGRPNGRPSNNDLGLIKLSRSATLNRTVQPIELATINNVPHSAIVSGWGISTFFGGSASDTLRFVEVFRQTQSTCNEEFNNFSLEADEICMGRSNGNGICSGDSGGGLVSSDSTLYGIASLSSLFCGTGYGVFSSVAFHRDWIVRTLERNTLADQCNSNLRRLNCHAGRDHRPLLSGSTPSACYVEGSLGEACTLSERNRLDFWDAYGLVRLKTCTITNPNTGFGDRFVTGDPDCEGGASVGPDIWLFEHDKPGTEPLYRCQVSGTGEHFLSRDVNCEGQSREGMLGYVID